MPLYEYQCSACGHRFERIVKFSDSPLKTCPNCGKDAIEQMISAPAVQFKGSGWYVTDYARKSHTPAASSTAKSEASADSATAAKESSSGSSTPAGSGGVEKSSGGSTGGNPGSGPKSSTSGESK